MENIVGHDHRMRKMFDVIDSVADTRATVLITGESGTGKSLIARAIHRRSGRRDKPFVEVACGACRKNCWRANSLATWPARSPAPPATRSASSCKPTAARFSWTKSARPARRCRSNCCACLQDLEFEQVGGTKTFHVDTRVILATNDDLGQAVAEGRFRQDLYYRINVINIELPRLRDRLSDIPLLAEHFLGTVCEDIGQARSAALPTRPWPLCNAIAGQAMSASCKTSSSAPCCWAKGTWSVLKTCRRP